MPRSLDLSRVPAFAHYIDSRYGVLSAAAFCCYVNQPILPSGRNRSHRGVSFSYEGIVLIWDSHCQIKVFVNYRIQLCGNFGKVPV